MGFHSLVVAQPEQEENCPGPALLLPQVSSTHCHLKMVPLLEQHLSALALGSKWHPLILGCTCKRPCTPSGIKKWYQTPMLTKLNNFLHI